jgi:hypothetical protein
MGACGDTREREGDGNKGIAPVAKQLIGYVHNSEMGSELSVNTRYGLKPLVYADYTASGRALTFLEEYMAQKAPLVANPADFALLCEHALGVSAMCHADDPSSRGGTGHREEVYKLRRERRGHLRGKWNDRTSDSDLS